MKLFLFLASLLGEVFAAENFAERIKAINPRATVLSKVGELINVDLDGDGKNDTVGYICQSKKKGTCTDVSIGVGLGNHRNFAFGGSRSFPDNIKRKILKHPLALSNIAALRKVGCALNLPPKDDQLVLLVDGAANQPMLAIYWNTEQHPNVCTFNRPEPFLEDSDEFRPQWVAQINAKLKKQNINLEKVRVINFDERNSQGPAWVGDAEGDLRPEIVFYFEGEKRQSGFGVWLSAIDHIELFGAGQQPFPESWRAELISRQDVVNYPLLNSVVRSGVKCPTKDIAERFEIHAIEINITAPAEGRGYLYWWKGTLQSCVDFRAG